MDHDVLVHLSGLSPLLGLYLLLSLADLSVLLFLVHHLDRDLPFDRELPPDQLDRSDLPHLSDPVFLAVLCLLMGLVGLLALSVLAVL